MITLASILVAAIAAGGCLVLRSALRTAPALPRVARSAPPQSFQPAPVQNDAVSDPLHELPPRMAERMMEKLRQEEARQRPEEGRN